MQRRIIVLFLTVCVLTQFAASAQDTGREKVVGIGGLFFRAHNPDALAKWYRDALGIDLAPQDFNTPPWHTEAGPTLFVPFPENTGYFGSKQLMWMVNFRVRHLDKFAAQLRAQGIKVDVDKMAYHGARFAHLNDPEGNRIELWQPGP